MSEESQESDGSALLERWKKLQDCDDAENVREERKFWYAEACVFLNNLPQTSHCWCRHPELTAHLLKPNFFTDSSIQVLWRRFTSEFQCCLICISTYHEIKMQLKIDYEDEVVDPILTVLGALDCKRVADSMKSVCEPGSSANMMGVVFEIFRYPELVEDAGVDNVLFPFLDYISNGADLCLPQDQWYPGLYALLFHSLRSIRSMALELAKSLKQFSDAEDLEELQPVLEKRLKYLETGRVFGQASLTQESLWQGMQTMLQLLKPRAIEDGIVERYPCFLGIVFNNISEESSIFSHALCCLEILLKNLGYGLWLKLPFTPGVLRNNLVSQCFDAKDEKTHKSVFGTFEFFLQSLEPMQPEYKRQRRILLYFLLQEVPLTSKFGSFIMNFAPQVAFNIVSRSFKMDSASPPFECLHFLGSALLSSLTSTALAPTQRQPAIELIEFFLVADATVLAGLYPEPAGLENGGVDEPLKSSSFSWDSFIQKIERDSENWCCSPLIWTEALKSPVLFRCSSFIQAFVWAVSRVSVLDREIGGELVSSEAFQAAMKWQQPRGCDDGSDGTLCRNALKAGENLEVLITLFKRSADAFATSVREQGFVADWEWEPALTEPLLLLMMDSSEVLNAFGKELLGQFSNDHRFEYGIRFLCENEESLPLFVKSFRHVAKLFGGNPWKHSCSLQHVFFLALKLNDIDQNCTGTLNQTLSPVLWTLLLDCILKAHQHTDATGYEEICIQILELLPAVFKNMISTAGNDELWKVNPQEECPGWFEMLVSWSSTSSPICRRHCITALVLILEDIACGVVSTRARWSKSVATLLQPGSVIDNYNRKRLLLLFLTPPKNDIVQVSAPPQVLVVQRDPVVEDGSAVADQQAETPERFVKQHGILENIVKVVPSEQLEPVIEKAAPNEQLERVIEKAAPTEQLEPVIEKVRKQQETNEQALERGEREAEKRLNELEKEHVPELDHTTDVVIEKGARRAQLTGDQLAGKLTGGEEKLENGPALQPNERVTEELVNEDGPEPGKKQRAPAPAAVDIPAEQMRPSIISRNMTRAQRAPPMDDWLMRILCLDIFHNDGNSSSPELSAVPTSFTSSEHYIEVFRPLLLENFKAQLRKSQDEIDLRDEKTSGVVSLVSLERVDSMHLAKFYSEAGKDRATSACMENDLLLLSKQPLEKSSRGLHMLAKVDRSEHQRGVTIVDVKLYLPETDARLSRAENSLVTCSKWHLTRLMSITSQLREFQAVSAIASSPFVDIVLCPKTSATRSPPSLPEPLLARLSSDYDPSQLAAIKAALGDSQGSHQMSLVQGPPGAGKTKTIVAIISALMCTLRGSDDARSNSTKPITGQKLAHSKELEQDERRRHESQTTKRNRILVCTRSNAAVDELVARLLQDGIYNSSGQCYRPVIVRAGRASSVHPGSMPVFIDSIVEKKLAAQRVNDAENSAGDPTSLQAQLEQVTEDIKLFACRIATGESDPALAAQKRDLEKKKQVLTMELFKGMKKKQDDRAKKKLLTNEAFRDADIVLTTLSGCGGDVYAACMESLEKGADVFFDAVVIDEASQTLEPAVLIPLQLVATSQGRCVMVRDVQEQEKIKKRPAEATSDENKRQKVEDSRGSKPLKQGGDQAQVFSGDQLALTWTAEPRDFRGSKPLKQGGDQAQEFSGDQVPLTRRAESGDSRGSKPLKQGGKLSDQAQEFSGDQVPLTRRAEPGDFRGSKQGGKLSDPAQEFSGDQVPLTRRAEPGDSRGSKPGGKLPDQARGSSSGPGASTRGSAQRLGTSTSGQTLIPRVVGQALIPRVVGQALIPRVVGQPAAGEKFKNMPEFMRKTPYKELRACKYLMKGNNEKVLVKDIEPVAFLLLFSTSEWSTSMQEVGSLVSDLWLQMLHQGCSLDMIYVPTSVASDSFPGASSMLRVPLGHAERLKKIFDVKTSPALLLIDDGGRIIERDGVQLVKDYKLASLPPAPLSSIGQQVSQNIYIAYDLTSIPPQHPFWTFYKVVNGLLEQYACENVPSMEVGEIVTSAINVDENIREKVSRRQSLVVPARSPGLPNVCKKRGWFSTINCAGDHRIGVLLPGVFVGVWYINHMDIYNRVHNLMAQIMSGQKSRTASDQELLRVISPPRSSRTKAAIIELFKSSSSA